MSMKIPWVSSGRRLTRDWDKKQFEKERVEGRVHHHRRKKVRFGKFEHKKDQKHQQKNQTRIGDPVENQELPIVEFSEQSIQQNDSQKEANRFEDFLRGKLFAGKVHNMQQEEVEGRSERGRDFEHGIRSQ